MPALNDLAARTELRPFESLTLTDQQFLIGDKNGKAVTLAGGAPNCLQAGHRPTGSLGLKQRPRWRGTVGDGLEFWFAQDWFVPVSDLP
jgi:hypothetical protein